MIKNVNIDKIFEYMWDILTIYHYEKKGCFTTCLVIQFLSCIKHFNSLYLYIVSVDRQIA
jgi:hypothetical protein